MTNETLEQAAERLSEKHHYAFGQQSEFYQLGFYEGAKWQAGRSYSKEEVDDLLDRLLEGNMCSVVGEELIEKFKKV
jgi:hypothetical protein